RWFDVLGDQWQHAGAPANRRYRRGPPRRWHRLHRAGARSEAGPAHRAPDQTVPGLALFAARRSAYGPHAGKAGAGRGRAAPGTAPRTAGPLPAVTAPA